jgi:3-oxoacyl-[acyl-carrier protein] reductase
MAVALDLTGKTVLITGGTRGIGAALADLFESAGARLLLTGSKADDVARRNAESKGKREFLHADFSTAESTRPFLQALAARRDIDILINNAGVNRIQRAAEAGEADLDWMLSVNLRAPFLVAQAVLPGMVERKWGRIVNIASIWGVITKPGRSLYTATKHGIVGLTKTLAVEHAADGVLVNTVSPGFTRTELTASTNSPAEIEALARSVPAGRLAEPAEIGRVVLFLASDLNTYVTGQNLVVDGGFTNV